MSDHCDYCAALRPGRGGRCELARGMNDHVRCWARIGASGFPCDRPVPEAGLGLCDTHRLDILGTRTELADSA